MLFEMLDQINFLRVKVLCFQQGHDAAHFCKLHKQDTKKIVCFLFSINNQPVFCDNGNLEITLYYNSAKNVWTRLIMCVLFGDAAA